ncbi:MAG TPA: chitobiase/beta-hexosaminidase C-terminal domain-containing protein [Candidatus Limnocylindria bacterium]|nr:chitobiase/beta-hexosaminidase C-terminal domain-containing protein [Candidatus Limnocylindria bacterium]
MSLLRGIVGALGLLLAGSTSADPIINPTTNGPGSLINLQLADDSSPHKVGAAAVGFATNDVWNFYSRDGASGYKSEGSLTNLQSADGTPTGASMTILNAPGSWANGNPDAMYGTYLYPLGSDPNITLKLQGLAAGSYDLYLYGHAGPNLDAGNSVFRANVSRVDYGPAATTSGPGWTNTTWIENQQYVVFRGIDVEHTGDPLVVRVSPGAYPNSFISGLQLAQIAAGSSSSTNDPGNGGSNTNTVPGGDEPIVVNGNRLVDVQFGVNSSTLKSGFAAVGALGTDVWNLYSRDGAGGIFRTYGELTDLRYADGTDSGIDLAITNAPGAWGNGVDDPMYGTFLYPFGNSPIGLTLSSVPAGTYDLYLYGHGGPGVDHANSVFSAVSDGTSYGPASTTTGPDWASAAWKAGAQFAVLHSIIVNSTQPTIEITVAPGEYNQAFLNGLQLVGVDTNLAATLDLAPESNLYTNSVDVTIAGTNLPAGAEIRYTLDNTLPTATSSLYSGPLHLTGAVVVKAVAFLAGTPVSHLTARSYLQTDGTYNGMAIAWLQQYFGNGFLNDPKAASDADADGDGVSNLAEFTAGTNPKDPYSGFKVESKLVPSVTWNSVAGRRYQILFRPDPLTPDWTVIKEIIATDPISHYVDFGATNTSGFYTVVPATP